MQTGDGILEQQHRATYRVHRHVDITIVVIVGRGQAASVQWANGAKSSQVRDFDQPGAGVAVEGQLLTVLLAVDRHEPVGNHQVTVPIEVEIGPRHAPPGTPNSEIIHPEAIVAFGELEAGLVEIHRVELVSQIGDDEVEEAVAAVVLDGNSHPAVEVSDLGTIGDVDKPEPERIIRPGDVLVEPVGIGVVRHEQVQVTVIVQIAEHGPQPVLIPTALQSDLLTHLAKRDVTVRSWALVEVQQIAASQQSVGEGDSSHRVGSVRVDIAGYEDIGPTVAVDVANRRSGVPSIDVGSGGLCPVRERSVALVPHQDIAPSGGDIEICRPIEVEVGGDTATAPNFEADPGIIGDVAELATPVAVKGASGKPAFVLPPAPLCFGV